MQTNGLVLAMFVVLVVQIFFVINIDSKKTSDKNTENETKYDLKAKPGHFTCPCGKSFKTEVSLKQHMTATGHDKKYKKHSGEEGIPKEHQPNEAKRAKLQRSNSIDRDHNVDSLKARRGSISEMEKTDIAIDKNEKRNAKSESTFYIRKILNHVRTQTNGKIYSADFRIAGSNAVKTKVGSADEIDTNIEVKVDVKDVVTDGTLAYIYADKRSFDDKRSLPRQMDPERKLKQLVQEKTIPHGQAVVQLSNPSQLPHLTYKGDLIPHKVLQDLHSKVKTAIHDLKLSDVELSPTAQGPALTITIKQHNFNDISVDLVPSLPCSLPVTINGWPRKETRSAFSKKINSVKNAGLHLVPKGDETWTISYSKAEKELLEGIDENNEYRRGVLKVLKQYLRNCKEKSPDGLPGLSSHIVKIQVLWSSEKRRAPGYWSQKYKDRCLLDTVEDMILSLETQSLPEYFDGSMNILAHKEKSELKFFANCLRKEKEDLENITQIKDEL